MAAELVDDKLAQIDLSILNLEDRVALISNILQSEGFTIELTSKDEGFEIRETSCPYKHIGTDHPEICLVDETMIEKVLATNIEKTHCVLDGDPFCAYLAPTISTADIKIN